MSVNTDLGWKPVSHFELLSGVFSVAVAKATLSRASYSAKSCLILGVLLLNKINNNK